MQFLNLDFVVPFLTGQVGVVASDRIPFRASRYLSCAMDGAPHVISFSEARSMNPAPNFIFFFFLEVDWFAKMQNSLFYIFLEFILVL